MKVGLVVLLTCMCYTQGAVSGLHMVQCFHEAGLPAGLLSVATGRGSEIGDFLTQHPGVNCISFTGGDTGELEGARVIHAALHRTQTLANPSMGEACQETRSQSASISANYMRTSCLPKGGPAQNTCPAY